MLSAVSAPRLGRLPLAAAALLLTGALIAGCGGSGDATEESEAAPPATNTEAPASEAQADDLAGDGGGTVSQGDGSKQDNGGAGSKGNDGESKGGGGGSNGNDGGSKGGGGQGEPDPSEVDSKENDTPPEKGSPAEAFEAFCDENPKACS